MKLRILASIILVFSMLFGPFLVSVFLAFSFMAYFHFFWEAIFIFFLTDLLYGVEGATLYGVFYVNLTISVVLLLIIEFLKKNVLNDKWLNF
jgi:hypothetical protein